MTKIPGLALAAGLLLTAAACSKPADTAANTGVAEANLATDTSADGAALNAAADLDAANNAALPSAAENGLGDNAALPADGNAAQ